MKRMQKLAIFDEQEQNALLGACQESDNEYIPIWLMLRCGMHPHDISKAKDKFRFNGQFLEWKRAKNSKPRREIIPKDVRPRLEKWLKHGRKLTRVGYNQLVHRIGARVGHPEYSPLSLRHTFGLQELRGFMKQRPPPPDFIALVAQKMGCKRETVMQFYIDLTQWAGLGGQQDG
jgi:integrase